MAHRMTEGEKLIWASVYSSMMRQWQQEGQRHSLNEAMIGAIHEANGIVLTLRELHDTLDENAEAKQWLHKDDVAMFKQMLK